MLHLIFGCLLAFSLLFALLTGQGDTVMAALLAGADGGVSAALSLAGGFAFFCGMIEILRQAGILELLAKRLAPLLRLLLGKGVPDAALAPAAMNLAANMLGLGNAATPMGMEAARRMASGEAASNALCLFLVINASSVQLLPSTVISLRAAAGSLSPGAVTGPGLLASLISTAAGILACRLMEGKE